MSAEAVVAIVCTVLVAMFLAATVLGRWFDRAGEQHSDVWVEENRAWEKVLAPHEPGSLEQLPNQGWDVFFFNEREAPCCSQCGGESGGLDECIVCYHDGKRAER